MRLMLQHFRWPSNLHLEEKPCIRTRKELSPLENLRCCQHLERDVIKLHPHVPSTEHGRVRSKKSVTEIAPSCVCREQAVIPALNRASAYRLLQSIDNSSRKEGAKREGVKKFASLSLSLPHWSNYAHRHIKYAELGLAPGNLIYL